MWGTAAAASSRSTVRRTSSEPARANAAIWRVVASMSAVSVLVIDWTTIGPPPPTTTAASPSPTRTPTVAWRESGPEGVSDIARLIAAILLPSRADRINPGRILSAQREFVIRDVCSAMNPSKASLQCNMTALARTVSPRGPMRRNADVARQTPRPRHRFDERHWPGDRPRPRQGRRGHRHQRVRRQGGDRGRARQDREGIRRQGLLQRGRYGEGSGNRGDDRRRPEQDGFARHSGQ